MKTIVALLLALCPLAAMSHGDLHERIAALTARLQNDPTNALLLLERGELHRQHGEFVAALDDLAAAERLDPGLDRLDFARGRTRFESREWRSACAALNRHLERHPDHVTALLLKARCLVALGENDAAAKNFDRGIALAAAPEPDDYLDRSAVLLTLGRADEALRGLDDGLARIGPAVPLQLRAIDLEVSAGRIDVALDRLARAAASAPRREVWLEKRATLLRRAGRNLEASASAGEAIALLDTLPASRRTTPSVVELETRLRALVAVSP